MNPILILLGIFAGFLFLFLLPSPSGRIGRMSRHMSDAEFLAAVPSANPERALRVRAIISEQLDVPYHDIHPDDSLVDDLGAG